MGQCYFMAACVHKRSKPCGRRPRKTPPLGEGVAGFRLPKLSKVTGAAETVRGGPVFRIEWAAQPGGVRALQTLLFGRSNKQCEQSNHAHSDNQQCKCYGIVVQPIQPLLHDTPPLRSETATKTMPSGRLALSIKKVRREPAGRAGRALRMTRFRNLAARLSETLAAAIPPCPSVTSPRPMISTQDGLVVPSPARLPHQRACK
jgi:hypothetical protein